MELAAHNGNPKTTTHQEAGVVRAGASYLARARLRLRNDVTTTRNRHNGTLLDRRRLLKAVLKDATQEFVVQRHVVKRRHRLDLAVAVELEAVVARVHCAIRTPRTHIHIQHTSSRRTKGRAPFAWSAKPMQVGVRLSRHELTAATAAARARAIAL